MRHPVRSLGMVIWIALAGTWAAGADGPRKHGLSSTSGPVSTSAPLTATDAKATVTRDRHGLAR